MNSPLKLKDDNGEDVIVTIVGNSITFSSTVFVTGPGASEVAKNANRNFDNFSKATLQNRTYKDVDGKVYNVQIKMNFVAVDPANSKDPNLAAYNNTLNDKVGGSGNNLLNITNDKNNLIEGRANANHPSGANYVNSREDFLAGNGQIQSKALHGVGNMAWLNADVSTASNGIIAIHETLHNFGLGDRYIEKVPYKWTTTLPDGSVKTGTANVTTDYPGFQNDMMNNNSLGCLNQAHIDNLANNALKLSKTKGNNFVMAQKVDDASKNDLQSAPAQFEEGRTIYIKTIK